MHDYKWEQKMPCSASIYAILVQEQQKIRIRQHIGEHPITSFISESPEPHCHNNVAQRERAQIAANVDSNHKKTQLSKGQHLI